MDEVARRQALPLASWRSRKRRARRSPREPLSQGWRRRDSQEYEADHPTMQQLLVEVRSSDCRWQKTKRKCLLR